MGPRSAGFEDIEAFAQQAEEEETQEPAYHDDEDEEAEALPTEEDELALAEREYLNEMRSGIHVGEEDGIAI